MTEQPPSVDQAFGYITERLRTIFEYDFSDNIEETLNVVGLMVADLQERAAPVGKEDHNMQYRFAALDAAIRILPEARTDGILNAAKDIEKFLSGSEKPDDSMPLTN